MSNTKKPPSATNTERLSHRFLLPEAPEDITYTISRIISFLERPGKGAFFIPKKPVANRNTERMVNNMAKAKKLPSGTYRCQVFDYTDLSGKRRYKSFTAETKKEAEYKAAEFMVNKKDKGKVSSKTFGQALENYISIREPVLSPRSIINYRRIQSNDLSILSSIKISDITQELIQHVINEDIKTHAPKTVRDNHGLIAAVLKEERPGFALNTVLPQSQPPKIYVPTDDEIKQLLFLAEGTVLELPILLAAFGPMRRGEICALHSDWINGNVVHVARNMVITPDHKWIIKQPKSYAGDRFIDYPEFVAEKWRGISGMITTLCPDNLSLRFARFLKKSGIHHFRFHDLRHYSASIQHALGIPDAYIMQRGGWGNDGVLKNVYRHTMTGKIEEMNRVANSYFDNLYNTKCNTKK